MKNRHSMSADMPSTEASRMRENVRREQLGGFKVKLFSYQLSAFEARNEGNEVRDEIEQCQSSKEGEGKGCGKDEETTTTTLQVRTMGEEEEKEEEERRRGRGGGRGGGPL